MGPASARYCALILTAAVAAAQGAAGSETTQFGTGLAGGTTSRVSLTTAPAQATELGLSVGAGETDNVFLSAAPTTSQTIAMLGLNFNLQRDSTLFTAAAKGDFQYFDYLQNAYGNQLFGRFDGLASAQLVPGVWKWVVQDDFGQAQTNPFAPLTPLNLEYVNLFATGPDFRLRTTDTGFVDASIRYALTHYQTSPLSGNRLLARVGVGEQMSAASSVSLNVDETRLRFNDTVVNGAVVNTDYDRRELYARYEAHGARTALAMDLGVSETDDNGHWVSAPLAELNVKRAVTEATTLTVVVGHQLTDASDSFRGLKSGAAGGIVIAPVAGTTATYLSNYASGELRFERNRTAISVSAMWERDTYARTQAAALDATRGGVSADVQRRITPLLSLEVFGSWQHTHYYNGGYEETDWPVGAALVLHPGQRTEFKLRVDHTRQDVTGTGTGYSENRALLSAEYRPWP